MRGISAGRNDAQDPGHQVPGHDMSRGGAPECDVDWESAPAPGRGRGEPGHGAG